MIYAMIVVGLAVCGALYMGRALFGYFSDYLSGLIGGAFVGAMVSLASAVVISVVIPATPIFESNAPIKALKDGNTVSGSFFLGTGTVDGEIEYRFMSEEEDGGLRMNTVSADDAVIYDTTDAPRVETYTYEFKSRLVRLLFGPGPLLQDAEYRIYVPEGTVKYEYVVDLK